MLISFEGIDGCGKSTQINRLREDLTESGAQVLVVREPGGTIVSERIRDILLDATLEMDPFAEMLLFSAARSQLVRTRITSALREGQVVVCDRFFDSTIAYQGAGRRVADPVWLSDFQRKVTGGLVPARTYFIRLDPDLAAARLTDRSGKYLATDRMERAGTEFFVRVAEAYENLADAEPERFVVIDGTQSVDEIARTIRDDFRTVFPAIGK